VTHHWFLPNSEDLLGMLQRQLATTIEGMDAFAAWAAGDAVAGDTTRALEHRADALKHELQRALRQAFTTPLEPEDLFALSHGTDRVLNKAKDVVGESEVMACPPEWPVAEMALLLAQAMRSVSEAVSQSCSRRTKSSRSRQLTARSPRLVASRSTPAHASCTSIASSRCPSSSVRRRPACRVARRVDSSRSTHTARSVAPNASMPRATQQTSLSNTVASPPNRPMSPPRRSPALAGVAPEPAPVHPVIHGMLLTGGQPLYLSAHVTGGHGSSSRLSGTPAWSPPAKIAARYLAPYLHELDIAAGGAR
jgi:Protein of unknown function DUF47